MNNQLQININNLQKDFEKDIQIKMNEILELSNQLENTKNMFNE